MRTHAQPQKHEKGLFLDDGHEARLEVKKYLFSRKKVFFLFFTSASLLRGYFQTKSHLGVRFGAWNSAFLFKVKRNVFHFPLQIKNSAEN